jgi:hypothetical protein
MAATPTMTTGTARQATPRASRAADAGGVSNRDRPAKVCSRE